MLIPTDSPCPIRFPSNANRRQFVERAGATAALMTVHSLVIPLPVDEHGAPLSGAAADAQQAEIQHAITELAPGRRAHARQTIARLVASSQSDSEHVEQVLEALYAAHSRGESSTETMDGFLDTFETWLNPRGITKVDQVFSAFDLNRAPEALGIVLLATTRLTKTHFKQRDGFLERLTKWLVGRDGRTPEQVAKMLEGLRA